MGRCTGISESSQIQAPRNQILFIISILLHIVVTATIFVQVTPPVRLKLPTLKLSMRTKFEVEGDHEGVWRPSVRNANPVDVRPEYLTHRRTLKAEFPNGWSPPRKLSREAMDGLRALHGHDPKMFSTPFLASTV
ncbi:hypothetical protein BS47DRAFT_472701 [Hydnum rufescens UP504]|uniref:Uncharacterized protein n=1 Tax=Hydnum rufescens UP504 TaxID=1448309 RepID=A0A9P6B507_9AGAM|nr:hypothetical protein BS47DRAFT_472701 [Hydnum rufescens UP504]